MPTLLASPYLPKGTVCSQTLQHTSVLSTTRKLFGIGTALTKRDAAAPPFDGLFLAAPRTDAPATLGAPAAQAAPPDPTAAAPDDYMSEMARDWRRRTGGLPGAPRTVPTPTSQDEVHQFLRSQIQLFLDYRAAQARRKPGRRKHR